MPTTNIILNTITLGALYALIALGFTLIFGVAGVFNLAHGSIMASGAFIGYILTGIYNLPAIIGVVGGVAGAGLLGYTMYTRVIKHVEENQISVLVLTLLAAFVIQYTFGAFVTRTDFTIPVIVGGRTDILGQTIQHLEVFIVFTTFLIIVGLFKLFNDTDVGRAIIAMSMSNKGCALVGIDQQQLTAYTWVLASALAGFAGLLLATIEVGGWEMGWDPFLIAFAIVIIGGLGSIKGSIVAAFFIAFIEVFTTSVIHPELTGVVPLIMMVAVLLVRPKGIWGREVVSDE